MALILLGLPGNEEMTDDLAEALAGQVGILRVRRFPDQESYVRLLSQVRGCDVVLVCTLDDPDRKLAQLLFTADLVRQLGGKSVGLVAPYLAYMRQDSRFESGEAITSGTFARLISTFFDWLVTVDPHLHRYASLQEIYTIPTGVAHAAPLLGDWIMTHVPNPLIVGPDSESEQWVSEVAAHAHAPHVTFAKRRLGDRNVEVKAPDLSAFHGKRAVLVDDIASSGTTLCKTTERLTKSGFPKPVCLVVHALMDGDQTKSLQALTSNIFSTNSIIHATNRISVAILLAGSVRNVFGTTG
jgi:ribose-phosphate pyrophosphokinase